MAWERFGRSLRHATGLAYRRSRSFRHLPYDPGVSESPPPESESEYRRSVRARTLTRNATRRLRICKEAPLPEGIVSWERNISTALANYW